MAESALRREGVVFNASCWKLQLHAEHSRVAHLLFTASASPLNADDGKFVSTCITPEEWGMICLRDGRMQYVPYFRDGIGYRYVTAPSVFASRSAWLHSVMAHRLNQLKKSEEVALDPVLPKADAYTVTSVKVVSGKKSRYQSTLSSGGKPVAIAYESTKTKAESRVKEDYVRGVDLNQTFASPTLVSVRYDAEKHLILGLVGHPKGWVFPKKARKTVPVEMKTISEFYDHLYHELAVNGPSWDLAEASLKAALTEGGVVLGEGCFSRDRGPELPC